MGGIVIDTSALVRIFQREDGWEAVLRTLSQATRVILPGTCLVEATLLRTVHKGLPDWVVAIQDRRFELGQITESVARLAAEAARTYGKGSGHKAQLNFGDCFSYAVAKHADLPLLFVGDDFAHTDITPALEAE